MLSPLGHPLAKWQRKMPKVSCTFRGFVFLLRFVAILFSRFLRILHCRVCLSSLVALPRNSSFATNSLKNQRLDIPWVPEAFHARFLVTVKSSADEALTLARDGKRANIKYAV